MDDKTLTALVSRLTTKAKKQMDESSLLKMRMARLVRVRKDTFKKIYDANLFKSAYKAGDNAGSLKFNKYLDQTIQSDFEISMSAYFDSNKNEFYYVDAFYNSYHFTF